MNLRKTFTSIITLAVFTVLYQGCVRYFCKVSDIRNDMNGFSRTLERTIFSLDRFQNNQWEDYRYLSRLIDDTTREPFPQMFSSLQKLGAAANRLRAHTTALIDLRCDFEDFVGEKGSIESGTPEWDTLTPITAKYSSLVREFNDLIDEANDIKEEVKKKVEEAKGIINAKR